MHNFKSNFTPIEKEIHKFSFHNFIELYESNVLIRVYLHNFSRFLYNHIETFISLDNNSAWFNSEQWTANNSFYYRNIIFVSWINVERGVFEYAKMERKRERERKKRNENYIHQQMNNNELRITHNRKLFIE